MKDMQAYESRIICVYIYIYKTQDFNFVPPEL